MFHVVFQHADVEALRKSFEIDPSMDGDIIEIKDDYAVGPLKNIYSEEGIATRKQWWTEVVTGGHYNGLVERNDLDDNRTVKEISNRLEENAEEVLWIWAAQNKHDVSGYYWLISQLGAFQGRVFILYLNNLPFINEKGHIFYPSSLFEIQPKEFVKAKRLARPVTLSEFEIDPDEWKKLCEEDKGVRLLEGGKKLVSKDYNYYDAELMQTITGDWQKGHKLMHHFFSKAKETTGDAYMLWRLKLMVEEGKVDVQGNFLNMKEFEVKKKVAEVSEV